jgi:salicylate hydroxylase
VPPLAIAVAGAGPAGLAATLMLGRAGHRVTLVDRFEAPAPVGSGLMLQATGLAVLDALGLGARIRGLGRRIDRLFGRTVGGRTVLDVRYAASSAALHGLAVHRAALFDTLHDAVRADGHAVEGGLRIEDLHRASDDRPMLVSSGGRRMGPFDLVVDATGARSPLIAHAAVPVARRPLGYGALWATVPWDEGCGFGPHWLEQRYVAARVMVGVLPVGRREPGGGDLATLFWSIRPDRHAAFLAAGLSAWKDEVAGVWPACAPLLDAVTRADDLILAAYGHHTLPIPCGRRIAFVGDSAHSTSPQLGQGANMALLDAAALARALETSPDVPAALERYARLRRWHVRTYQLLSALFTPLYQSDGRLAPALRDVAAPVVSRLPFAPALLAELVAGLVVDPLPALGLRRP